MERTVRGFDRITVDPAKLGGQPCLRGYRFSVEHLLELLAAGWTVDEIRAAFSFIEPDDVKQILEYAAEPVESRLEAAGRPGPSGASVS